MNINVPQRPSDDEFKVHLESLFNPEETSELDPADYVSDIYVPVLDDPIDPIEVSDVLQKQLNANKSGGVDGLSPKLFKQLSVRWILTLTAILNTRGGYSLYEGYYICSAISTPLFQVSGKFV